MTDMTKEFVWEGVVEDVEDGFFTAVVHSLSLEIEPQWARFNLNELSHDDRALVVTGAIFRWVMSERSGAICFQRTPCFPQTREEVRQAADALAARLGWNLPENDQDNG